MELYSQAAPHHPFSTRLSFLSLPNAELTQTQLTAELFTQELALCAGRGVPELGLQLGLGTLCSFFSAARSPPGLPSAAGGVRVGGNTALCSCGRAGGGRRGRLAFLGTKIRLKISIFKQKNMSVNTQETCRA